MVALSLRSDGATAARRRKRRCRGRRRGRIRAGAVPRPLGQSSTTPRTICWIPGASARSNFRSLMSMAWTISAICPNAGSGFATTRTSVSNVQASPSCVKSPPTMSNRNSPGVLSSLGSMNRKVSLGIDEAADQPRRGDPVDVQAAARCPDASSQCRPSVFPRCIAPLLQGREQGLRSLAAGGVEKIDRFDFGLLSPEPGKARGHHRICGVPGLHREGGVVHVPLIPEPADEFLGCDAVDEFGLGDVGRAAGRPGLLDDPPKDFEVLGIAGKHVDRILEGQCAGTRETMPDPGAQVDRLRRELMNEQVPPLAGHRALVSTVRSICQPL